jgi:cell division protein ZapA
MAEVTIEIAGRRYPLACRDGEEAHLKAIGRMVDAKAIEAGRAMGGLSEARQLLLAALLLADELGDMRAAPRGDEGIADMVEHLAERMESLAGRLEKRGASA